MSEFNKEQISKGKVSDLTWDELTSLDVTDFNHKDIEARTGINMYVDKYKLYNIANSSRTGFEVLDYLSKHEADTIRERVAWNKNTLPGTLDRLMKDECSEVVGRLCL